MVEIRNIAERLKQHTVIDEIESIKLNLKDKEQEIEDTKKKLEQLNEDNSKLDIPSIKNNLKQEIGELLDIELDID